MKLIKYILEQAFYHRISGTNFPPNLMRCVFHKEFSTTNFLQCSPSLLLQQTLYSVLLLFFFFCINNSTTTIVVTTTTVVTARVVWLSEKGVLVISANCGDAG